MRLPIESIVIVAAFLSVSVTAEIDFSKLRANVQWTWECNDGKCQKAEASNTSMTQTLEVCRLTCGSQGILWPVPTQFLDLAKCVVPFDPENMTFEFADVPDEVKGYLDEAVNIFKSYLTGMTSRSTKADNLKILKVRLFVNTSTDSITWGTDESYSLSLSSESDSLTVDISAATFFGARHGLETLSQLIVWDSAAGVLVILEQAEIQDQPVFTHRGFLLDTSRNFYSLDFIKKTLDVMASNKLNALHWHLTDTHSFPYQSKRVPQMSEWGAYSSEQIYTNAQIAELVEYARVRGVRLIPELDAPAHAGNGWQWGEAADLGTLAVCVNERSWSKNCIEPPCGQLNPGNENVYVVLKELYKDFLEDFHSDIFHMGGDEVYVACWNNTQEVVDWMKSLGMGRTTKDFLDAWSIFQDKALKALDEANNNTSKMPVLMWTSELTGEDVIESYLDKDRYVIQMWIENDDQLAATLVNKGYRVIFSTKNTWYLDHGFGNWKGTSTSGYGFHPWQTVYNNNPYKILDGFGVDPATARELVLGVEAVLWSEMADEFAAEGKVWPRAAAYAEGAWSNPDFDWTEARYRMMYHRQRLVQRGVRADSLQPQWCFQNEGLCS